ncbi:DNA polymerase nu-like isoform X3 [Limulus polyphemus]|uniref:DNA polymerase nu-like isoform X3 n=1 Tax=Limulus polyphemus TaxID=6850 RepID=A0ABM1TJB2_LIMPO|nr:DNA polymerase nu-like isoform X3 [Limulus polyphemus]
MYMCVCMCMYPCLFILNLMIVIKQWCVHDIKIAAWLLNPEKVPETLADVKQIFPLDQVTDPGDACKVSSKISSLENLENFYSVIKDQLKEQNLFSLFINVEVKLIPVLSVMELRGIKVNKNTFLEEKKILQERIQQVEKEAYKVAGRKFSINSHPQLRQVLFDELKLDSKLQKITLTTVNNLKSTCEAVLEALKDYHPLPQLILEYRHLVKVKSTYVDGLITHIQNGLLCTTWDQTAAVTGRLSSANPNLQAIPKLPVCLTKSENQSGTAKRPEQKVLRIRDPFISQEGWSLLAADRFPGIKQFTKKCITECKKTGYVCSLLKRRRVLPHLNSMNHVLQMQAERQAINFLIQGSAADICKSAMVEVENEIAAHTNLHARLLVQLHDELLWEVPDIELEATKCLVKKVMEDTGRLLNQQVILEVPITVSLSVGKTWGGMTSLPP